MVRLILLLFFVIYNTSTPVYGQDKISFTKHSEITGTQENFLGSPSDIMVHGGRVYIADVMDLKIKVFSRDGEFIREMGGRGRGPGEFLNLTAVWLDNEGHISVADYQNAKITVFDDTGTVIDELTMNSKMVWPRSFHTINNQEYLVLYESQSNQAEVFHVWDAQVSNQIRSFNLHPEIIGDDQIKKEWLGFDSGISMLKDSTLFYAPFFYEGNIYSRHLYQDDDWTVHNGKQLTSASYEELKSGNLKNSEGENIYDYRMNSAEGSFAFRLYNSSKAIFGTKEGYLAHFVEIRQGDQKQQGIELYDSDGSFLGYHSYHSEDIREDRYTLIPEQPKAIDSENFVYTIDWHNEQKPAINIYQLEVRQ